MHFFRKLHEFKLLFWLLGISLFCFCLSIYRFSISGTKLYLFLNWNLFLSFIPWLISYFLVRNKNLQDNSVLFYLLLFVWLLFFPNAPYIITDLIHLKFQGSSDIPLWFDVILIFSFAWVGLSFGFISLIDLEKFFKARFKWKFLIDFGIIFILFLSSFGVYIGRFLRWNSWDLISNPYILFQDVYIRVIDPFSHPGTWGMTILMGTLLNIIFWTIKLAKNDK